VGWQIRAPSLGCANIDAGCANIPTLTLQHWRYFPAAQTFHLFVVTVRECRFYVYTSNLLIVSRPNCFCCSPRYWGPWLCIHLCPDLPIWRVIIKTKITVLLTWQQFKRVELAIWNKNSQSRHGLVCIFCSHVHTELLFFRALIQENDGARRSKRVILCWKRNWNWSVGFSEWTKIKNHWCQNNAASFVACVYVCVCISDMSVHVIIHTPLSWVYRSVFMLTRDMLPF
jgi:hypothetical protein